MNDNKKKACPRNHDYKVRLFMDAMRVPHELGFYGVDNDHSSLTITPLSEIDDVVGASWMASIIEAKHSEHEEPFTSAEVEENVIQEVSHEKSDEVEALPDSDLILFT